MPIITETCARLLELALLAVDRVELYAPLVRQLFPMSRVAMQALLEAIATTLDAVADFLGPSLPSADDEAARKVEFLRDEAARVRALATQGAPTTESHAKQHPG